MSTAIMNYHMPKGIIWQGERYQEYLTWYDVVIRELLLDTLEQIPKELNLDTCSDDTLQKLFMEANVANLFPQTLVPEDFKRVLKFLRLARNWVTLTDIIEAMALLDYKFEYVQGIEVFKNPSNYPGLQWKPPTEEQAWGTLYYKLIPITEAGGQMFPLPFPIAFGAEKHMITENLLDSLIDAHIYLYRYETLT